MTPPLAAVLADAPLDPSSDEARRWLEDELARGEYHPQPGLLERVMEWLDELFSGTGGGSLPGFALPLVIALALVVAALVLVVVLRRDTSAPTGAGSGGVLDVPDVPADALRARARAALAAGDWDGAVLDGLRAIARRAVERVVLDDAPGRTAHEVSRDLAAVFPVEDRPLASAADAFDAVRYGHTRASEQQARDVLALDERLGTARPAVPSPSAAPAEVSRS